MTFLTNLFPEEIEKELNISPSFRSRQIFKDIYKGITNIELMTSLPLALRNDLKTKADIFSSVVSKTLEDTDNTAKLQIILHDGLKIESVLLVDNKDRKTACISTQAGCAMDCKFCKTGTLGFKRNLESGEIIEQFLHLKNNYGDISNIVFMGMGEPLLNLENVKKSIMLLNHKIGLNFSLRRFTISTCGIVKGIKELADSGLKVKIALSLNSSDNEKRCNLMPITKSNNIADLKDALQYYYRKTKKRITIEYVLIKDVNDNIDDIEGIKRFVENFSSVINIIPYNPVQELDYTEPGPEKVKWFEKECMKRGLLTTVRLKRGQKINGACGQLGEL